MCPTNQLVKNSGTMSTVLADMAFDLETGRFAPESVPSFALAPAFILVVAASETGGRTLGGAAGRQFIHLLDDSLHFSIVVRGFRSRHRGAFFDCALDDRLASLDQP